MKSLWLGICSLIALTGCVSADYADVSDNEEFRSLIGQKFRTREELLILGITSDSNYRQQVDFYVISIKPGFGGPEVVSRDTLAAGATVTIMKAMRCVNCLSADDYLDVDVVSDRNVRSFSARLMNVGPRPVFAPQAGQMQLESKIFEEIAAQ